MSTGYVITAVLSVVLALVLALGIQTYRVSDYKRSKEQLELSVNSLSDRLERDRKLYSEVLETLERSKAEANNLRSKIKELSNADKDVADWLSEPIPPRLYEILR